jgi:hypothetical protein
LIPTRVGLEIAYFVALGQAFFPTVYEPPGYGIFQEVFILPEPFLGIGFGSKSLDTNYLSRPITKLYSEARKPQYRRTFPTR